MCKNLKRIVIMMALGLVLINVVACGKNVYTESASDYETSESATKENSTKEKTAKATGKKKDKSVTEKAKQQDEKKESANKKTAKDNSAKKDKKTEKASKTSASDKKDVAESKNTNAQPYYDRAMAEAVWSLVNAERTSSGLEPLAWDEQAYNFACGRCVAIMTDFSHNGCGGYGENIFSSSFPSETASDIHGWWYNSPGHHENYMSANYGSGACAVYRINGKFYAVENFSLKANTSNNASDGYSDNVSEPEQTYTEPQNDGPVYVSSWTASNGVVVYVDEYGNLMADSRDPDMGLAAIEEYQSVFGW